MRFGDVDMEDEQDADNVSLCESGKDRFML